MSNKNQILRLNIIDDLLCNKKWIKTSTIKKVVLEKTLENVSLRTIQNDIRDLKEDTRLGYKAPIEYDKKNKAYKYSEQGYTIKNFGLGKREIEAFKFYAGCLEMFSGYSLFNDFSTGLNKIIQGVSIRSRLVNERNPHKIIQTDSLTVAVGNEMLGDVIAAIDNEYKLDIIYQSFEGKPPSKRVIFPYFIKEYKHRWYLLGVPSDENDIKTFAFDRIKELIVVEEKFAKTVPFDAEEYFRHSFGIITPKDEATDVQLRFDKAEAPYITSLPIHHTQKIIKETKKYLDISIRVRISYELKEFILSKTPRVKVMSPEHLSKEITTMLLEGQKKYAKKASRN